MRRLKANRAWQLSTAIVLVVSELISVNSASAQDTAGPPRALPKPDAQSSGVAKGTEADIVITGSRLRNEAVQKTPVAVSVLSGTQITDLHTSDVRGLNGAVPNLLTAKAFAGLPAISIRGFSTI